MSDSAWHFDERSLSLGGAADAVRIWAFDIGPAAYARIRSAPSASACLSPAEQARAARFLQPEHARRFVAFHVIKRQLLATALQCEPRDVPFSWLPSGAPVLGVDAQLNEIGDARDWPSISLSHSRDVGVLALAKAGVVGVDVECQRSVSNLQALVAHRFDAADVAQFNALAGHAGAQRDLFFQLWTAREARYKCTGSYARQPAECVLHWQKDGFSYAAMHAGRAADPI